MAVSEYLAGLLFFLPTMAAVLAGARLLLVRRYPQLAGAARATGFGVLALLGLLAVHVVPAALTILGPPVVLAASALWLAAAALVRPVARAPVPEQRAPQVVDRLGAGLARAAVLAVAVLAAAIAWDQLFLPPAAVDTLNFHLPTVVSWIQERSLWEVGIFLPDAAVGHFPNNGDVLLLAAVLPWSNDFLAHLMMYPVWLLTGLATYALGREIGAARESAAVAAAVLLALPAVVVPALIGSYTDIVTLFGLAAGLVFLVRHHRSGHTSELVLAGLSLGIAFGAKWYGVSSIAVVLVVWAAARLIAGRRARLVAAQGAALLGLVSLAGGVWLLRNWLDTGNPVFPVRVAPFGAEIFDAPADFIRERAGFTIVDYLDDPGVWSELIVPQYRDVLALPGLLLLAGLVVAALLVLGRSAGPRRHAFVIAGAVTAAALLAAYSITPYSAGGPAGWPILVGSDARYGIPALVLAAGLCAWAATRLRHGAALLSVLALAATLDAASQVSEPSISGTALDRQDWIGGVGIVALAAGGAWLARRIWARLSSPARRRVAIPLAACALVAASIGGYGVQKRFNGVRYLGIDPAVDRMLAAGTGLRVGLAGTWDNGIPPVLPAFGPDLDNDVSYVGREDDGFLRQYAKRERFVAAVRRGHYDYLFIGNGIPPELNPDAVRWAKGAGFVEVAASDRLTLLRAPGAGALRLVRSSGPARDREDVVAQEEAQRP